MGLANLALDTEKIVEHTFDGTVVKVRHVSRSKLNQFVENNMPPMPDLPDDPELKKELLAKHRDMRAKLFYEFLAREAVVGWDDPDLPYSEDLAVRMLTSEEFRGLGDMIAGVAMTSTDFRMAQDAVIKKFVPNSSPTTTIGEATGATAPTSNSSTQCGSMTASSQQR